MQGEYQLEKQPNGEVLLRQGATFLKIRLRVNPGPKKPREFLIGIKPYYRYISSLYPIEGNRYAFDCDNVPYVLSLGAGTAKIAVTMPKAVER